MTIVPYQITILSELDSPLIGYCTHNHSIVYITTLTLTIIPSPGSPPQSTPISGSDILNFELNQRHQIAILYKQNYIEIRRIDKPSQIIKKIADVNLPFSSEYPTIKFLNQQLYLIYPTVVEIIAMKDLSRSKYTDLVQENDHQEIYDLVLLDLIDSLTIGVLQLHNKLIVAIIPCTITEIIIQGVMQVVCLHPATSNTHPKTSYLAVLAAQQAKNIVKIFDLLTLKQISEIQLPDYGAEVQIESDAKGQCLLVHYLDPETSDTMLNIVYKINTAVYYSQKRSQAKPEPFVIYNFEVKMAEHLCILNFEYKESAHLFIFYFFRKQKLYFFSKSVKSNFRQKEEDIMCFTDVTFWKDNYEWKQIISTYLQIQDQYMAQNQKKMMNYSDQERQLEQYYEITKDFDSIVASFSSRISLKSKNHPLNQRQVQSQWQLYMQNLAKQRNFMKETMSLFKLDYQIVKEPFQERNLIGIQLQTCMKQMEGREGRVDARIREKKKELKLEQIRKEKEKEREKDRDREKGEGEVRPRITSAEIEIEQEQYNKFVAEYLAAIQKRQAQQQSQNRTNPKSKQIARNHLQLKLQLPKLSEQQLKIIQHNNNSALNLSHFGSLSSQDDPNPAWQHFLGIFNQIEQQISPLEMHLDKIVQKIDSFQHSSLQAIKLNQTRLKAEMDINLQSQIKTRVKTMLSKLKDRIKTDMNSSMQKLYRIEEKSFKQNEQIIQRFKQYAKLQVRHRVQIYHRSRRQLQVMAHQILKDQGQNQKRSAEY